MKATTTSAAGASESVASQPARVLLVLDRPVLVELVTLALNHGTCTVRTVTAVEDVETAVAEWQPRVLIVDMALNGLEILRTVRIRADMGSRLVVMGLVGRGDLRTKLAAFDAGADDILAIPFAPEELLARVIALTRRTSATGIVLTPVISVGGLEIDIVNHTVRAGNSELHLSPLELGLLYLLAANPGRVLTRKEIVDTLYGGPRSRARCRRPAHPQPACGQLGREPNLPRHLPGRAAAHKWHRVRVLEVQWIEDGP